MSWGCRASGLGRTRRDVWHNIGALIIRIGFGGILYYNHNKEPQNPRLIIKALTLGRRAWGLRLPATQGTRRDDRLHSQNFSKPVPTVDDRSCSTLRIRNYGNHGIFLIMGNAGYISSAVW